MLDLDGLCGVKDRGNKGGRGDQKYAGRLEAHDYNAAVGAARDAVLPLSQHAQPRRQRLVMLLGAAKK